MKPVTKMMIRRMRLGISQARLAEQIGVTQPRVSQWESRRQDLPPLRRAQIAKFLDTDPDTLTDDA